MIYILLGALGFVLMFSADIFGLKQKPFLQRIVTLVAIFILVVSSVFILMEGKTLLLPLQIRILGASFTLVYFILMVYSIVIEVSHRNEEKKLITTGTYALTRHPGVIWFLLFYISGGILFANTSIIIAGLLWTVFNITYVLLQERYIFVKLFMGYQEYTKETPMIIPSLSSIRKCINTLNGGKHEKLTRNA